MARILCVDTASNALDWLMRCQDAGHQVMWFDRNRKDGSRRMAGSGIVPKTHDLEAVRKKWLGWADLIYLPDNVAYIEMLEPYRKMGYPIFGPGVEATKMELDRQYGQKTMKDAGIAVLDSKVFHDYDTAIAYVKSHPNMLVSKPSGDANKALSYVAHDLGDMVYMLERWKRRDDTKALARQEGFILQEKVKGIEMAVGGWFGPGGWSKWMYENWENKKLMNGDLGVATGEMGTVSRPVLKSRLADLVLKPIEKKLREIGYVGYIDSNCMIDEEGNPWPMEWTMRDGWPLRHNVMAQMTGDPAQWMIDLLNGKDTIQFRKANEVCISAVMAIPDFPYSKLTNKEVSGIPVYGATDKSHIHLSEVMLSDRVPVDVNGKLVYMPHYVTSGDYVLVCTGTGDTITGARRSCYSAIKKVKIPNNPFYRTDIGKGRLVKQIPELQSLGFAPGLGY